MPEKSAVWAYTPCQIVQCAFKRLGAMGVAGSSGRIRRKSVLDNDSRSIFPPRGRHVSPLCENFFLLPLQALLGLGSSGHASTLSYKRQAGAPG